MRTNRILVGDCLGQLKKLPDGCCHVAVTSPPYYGLRSYLPEGHEDKHEEIGLEETPKKFVDRLVEVFREVRRVLHDSGTLWVVIGDSYWAGKGASHGSDPKQVARRGWKRPQDASPNGTGYKPKDRLGIPHMLAFALRDDGWYWRDEVVWHKRNCMPCSVRDRTTCNHEFAFMFSKRKHYFYDQHAIRERSIDPESHRGFRRSKSTDKLIDGKQDLGYDGHRTRDGLKNMKQSGKVYEYSNKRSVWTLSNENLREKHYAAYPTKLIRPMILAGTSEKGCCPECLAPWVRGVEKKRRATRPGTNTKLTGNGKAEGNRDPLRHVTVGRTVGWKPSCTCGINTTIPCTVLDPFLGSGTTAVVARKLNRRWLGCELSTEYVRIATKRINKVRVGFGLA